MHQNPQHGKYFGMRLASTHHNATSSLSCTNKIKFFHAMQVMVVAIIALYTSNVDEKNCKGLRFTMIVRSSEKTRNASLVSIGYNYTSCWENQTYQEYQNTICCSLENSSCRSSLQQSLMTFSSWSSAWIVQAPVRGCIEMATYLLDVTSSKHLVAK